VTWTVELNALQSKEVCMPEEVIEVEEKNKEPKTMQER
jgi:hypothetical protein